MNKSILISIQPHNVVNILNGKKTLELRYSIPKDFIGWVYIYCTNTKSIYSDVLVLWSDEIRQLYRNTPKFAIEPFAAATGDNIIINGMIVARFWLENYATLFFDKYNFDEYGDFWAIDKNDKYVFGADIELKSCFQISKLKEPPKYAWYIKDLQIFDTPLQLSSVYRTTFFDKPFKINSLQNGQRIDRNKWLKMAEVKKAPQSWMYVYVKEDSK